MVQNATPHRCYKIRTELVDELLADRAIRTGREHKTQSFCDGTLRGSRQRLDVRFCEAGTTADCSKSFSLIDCKCQSKHTVDRLNPQLA